MYKKITSSLPGWIAVLCVPPVLLQMMSINFIGTRPAAAVFLLLDFVLLMYHRLYRETMVLLPLGFILWMECSGVFAGEDLMKVFGGRLARCWYLGLFAFLAAYIAGRNARKRLFMGFSAVTGIVCSASFVYFIVNAVTGLITGVNDAGLPGIFINGRLRALGNANVLGTVAAAAFAASVFFFISLKNDEDLSDRKRNVFTGIVRIAAVLCAIICLVTVSLSRSRGSIVAVSLFVGAVIFRALWTSKRSDGSCRDFFKAFFAAVFTCIVCFFLLIGIKKGFDACLIALTDPAARELTREALTPYGMCYALDTLTDRTAIWPAVIRYLREEPVRLITGITAAGAPDSVINYIYPGRPELTAVHAHSEFFQAVYTTGIPGLLFLLIVLTGWCAVGLRAFFSRDPKMRTEGLAASFLIVVAAMSNLEVYSFPNYGFHLLYYVFFLYAGLVAAGYRKKHDKMTFLPGVICAVFAAAILVTGAYAGTELLEERRETHLIADRTGLDLPASAAEEVMYAQTGAVSNADFWISQRQKAGADVDAVILSPEEIRAINARNRKMIVTGGQKLALADIGDVFNTDVLRDLLRDTYRVPDDPAAMRVGEVPTTASYWEHLIDDIGYDTMGRVCDTAFGFAAERTVLHKLPTEDVLFADSDPEGMYDEMAASDLQALEPVAILWESRDAEWYYVLTYGYGGWVPAKYIARCDSKEEWLKMQSPAEQTEVLVVTAKELTLPVNDNELTLYMGASLPAYSEGGSTYAIVPVRTEEGGCERAEVPVEASEDLHRGFLPYTEANVLKQAFRLLGTEYGWAGTNNTFDCSGFTREIFLTFGLELPRTAEAQAKMAGADSRHIFTTAKNKSDYVENLPAGSLLYFPGHIVLYLGSIDGEPYCMSAVGSLCTTSLAQGERIYANNTIVSDMLTTTRANGVSWLQSTERITTIH